MYDTNQTISMQTNMEDMQSEAQMNNTNDSIILLPQNTDCSLVVRFYIHFVCAGGCSVVGIVVNIISIIVMGRDRETTPVVSLLFRAMAYADCFFLVICLLTHSLDYLFAYSGVWRNLHPSWLYIRLYMYPLLFIGQTATIWLTVLIAGCRFMFVCLPYDVHKFCSYPVMQRSTVILIIASIAYNLPRYFEAQVYKMEIGNRTHHYINLTEFGNSINYRHVYFNILYYFFSFFLPLLLLMIFNSCLIVAYRRKQNLRHRTLCRSKSQRQAQGRERQEQNITLVMIVVVLAFLCCHAPARVIQMIFNYLPQFCPSVEFFLVEISTVLEVLNSSVNFFIYFAMRRTFRTTLQRMLCGARDQPVTSDEDTTMMVVSHDVTHYEPLRVNYELGEISKSPNSRGHH